MTAIIGEYKGHKTITLQVEGRPPFSFGVVKAKMILEHLKDIEQFCNETE